jgi:hypothetical protein
MSNENIDIRKLFGENVVKTGDYFSEEQKSQRETDRREIAYGVYVKACMEEGEPALAYGEFLEVEGLLQKFQKNEEE